MKTNYNIKNFRIFGIEGAEARIAPLTILTGCNSSGKSSIAKSILLLDNFLQKIKNLTGRHSSFALSNHTMDFTDYPLNLLGSFDKVLNSSSPSKEIEFRFTNNNFDIVLSFESNCSDVLNRGYLKSIMILKNEEIVLKSDRKASSLNVIPFYREFIEYSRGKLEVDSDFNSQVIGFDSIIREYWKKHKVSFQSLSWAIENNSFFNVPLLNKIGILDKKKFTATVCKLFETAYDTVPGLNLLMERLFAQFIESDCLTFFDFFKLHEKEWLSNICSTTEFDLPLSINEDWSWLKSKDDCIFQDEYWYDLIKVFIRHYNDETNGKIKQSKRIFPLLLTSLTIIGQIIGLEQDPNFSERISIEEEYLPSRHRTIYFLWEDFKKYVIQKLQKALIPSWIGNLSYVGSSRIEVRRLYTLDSKTDFSALLNRYFNTRRDFIDMKVYENETGYKPDTFMNKWLNKFGICDSAMLELDPEGLGVNIKLHKGDHTSLLADEGYGITQLFSILLEIETGIQFAFHQELVKLKSWDNEVLGDFMVHRIDTESFPEQTIIIEEPEIHLHPKFQSLLVDMFAEAKEKYNIHFIIETHSEYFIRSLQVRVAEKKISAEDVSVIYVDEDSHPYNMGLNENGKFSQDFGPGFFDEADNAAIQLFDLNS